MSNKNDPRLPGNYMPVKLQIEVGKRYRTRSGDVVEVTAPAMAKNYPFHAIAVSVTGKCLSEGELILYTKTGRYDFGQQSCADLIEELPARCPHCHDALCMLENVLTDTR